MARLRLQPCHAPRVMVSWEQMQQDKKQKRKKLGALALICASAAYVAITGHPAKEPVPMYTSILTGQCWLDELLKGHPLRFQQQLGVTKEVFCQLLLELQLFYSLTDSKYVTADEQLAMFLYFASTGSTF
ncbi:hypothetical protein E1B28_012616 [Marasmius oreades]|uniref:DUF8040 domain-containing protein n=1 Tax=Marasmius oreades TaxID=181124 RepID=A0A9P7RRZ0_9AGAR|nr:uncharacterized protein E1B28_012616 [Marasmius oreades]KAG7088644.1 hypothetical protein E1B28_012616 [Marasmius oreades]